MHLRLALIANTPLARSFPALRPSPRPPAALSRPPPFRKQANVSPPTSSSPPSDRSVAAWERCLPPSRRRTSSSSDSGLPCSQGRPWIGCWWIGIDCDRLEWRYGHSLSSLLARWKRRLMCFVASGEAQEDSGRWSSARLLSLLTFAVRSPLSLPPQSVDLAEKLTNPACVTSPSRSSDIPSLSRAPHAYVPRLDDAAPRRTWSEDGLLPSRQGLLGGVLCA